MKFARHWILAMATIAFFSGAAFAQESSYTPGTVWNISNIEVAPGQFEKYMDYLSGDWKRLNEFGKKEGYVVSYHVFQVNNSRTGEPNLILAIETRDYFSNAEQLAQQKKLEAFLASNTRKMDAEFGDRKTMRKTLSGMELQELKLK